MRAAHRHYRPRMQGLRGALLCTGPSTKGEAAAGPEAAEPPCSSPSKCLSSVAATDGVQPLPANGAPANPLCSSFGHVIAGGIVRRYGGMDGAA